MDGIRDRLNRESTSILIAKGIFLVVAVVCFYLALFVVTVWWQTTVFLIATVLCAILIGGDFTAIKFQLLQFIGLEIDSDRDATRTADEILNLIRDRDSRDVVEVEIDEGEGKYTVKFEREE